MIRCSPSVSVFDRGLAMTCLTTNSLIDEQHDDSRSVNELISRKSCDARRAGPDPRQLYPARAADYDSCPANT